MRGLSDFQMAARIESHLSSTASRLTLEESLERRREEIQVHRKSLSATKHQPAQQPPLGTYGASRVQAFLNATEHQSAIHAEVALTGAVARYKAAAFAAAPPEGPQPAAIEYSLAAAVAHKSDTVALEEALDHSRRDLLAQIYRIRPAQRRLLNSASPTRHVSRLGSGPLTATITVPPTGRAAWRS